MEYLQKFKNYLLALTPIPSKVTVKNYVLDVKHFIAWCEQAFTVFDPKVITLSEIEQFKKAQQNHLSVRSLERHISSLRKFFQAMKMQGHVAASPFDQQTQMSQKPVDPYHLREFKDFLYVYNASNLTIKNYIIDIKQFFNWAEEVLSQQVSENPGKKDVLDSISNDLLNTYKDTLASKNTFSASSINRKLSSLRKYCAWAKSQNLLLNQTDYQLEPNAVSNISSTSSTYPLNSLLTTQQLASSSEEKEATHENPVKNNERLATKIQNYSSFPPFRLIQKISKGINYAFEGIIVSPLTVGFLATQKAVWSLRGKPIFRKVSYRNVTAGAVKNISKWTYNPLGISTKTFPWYKKAWFHARYTRPNWYKRYHSYAISHYFNWAILMIIMTALGFGFYNSFVAKPNTGQKLLAAATPNRILSFQGRLTDASNNPITSSTNLRFGIYTDATSTGSALLWQEVDTITPDSNGVFSVLLGKGSPIQQALFANNANLFLGITVGQTAELTPRQQLATVAYATNAETLQGLPPITQSGAGTNNVVLALNSAGNLSIGAASTFQTVGGAFTLAGDTLVLNTNAGTNGNITIAPNGQGFIDLQKPLQNSTNNNNIPSAQGSVEVDDTFAILATNSGVAAETINQNGSADIFTASSSGTTRFTIGNTGTITDSNYTTGGGVIYANANGLFLQTTAGNLGQCLTSTAGGAPTWGGCGGSGSNFWTLDSTNGVLYPINTTLDAFIGGTSSSSANFAFLNNAPGSGTPTASIAGNLTLNSTGVIQTTKNQSLTIGGGSTGNITLKPLNGNGNVTISGLGTGVVQATGGVLSTGNVDLSSEVTSILPLTHGGTGSNITTGSQGGIPYFNTATSMGVVAAAGTSGLCLLSGGTGTPTWANCATAASNWWNVNQGVLFPINQTFDLVLGSSTGATTSAKFSVLNMTGSGTPTASVSSGLNGVGTYITANGTLQTTSDQGLTIGGASTGNIALTPQNGSGYVTINGNINSNLIPQTTDLFSLGSSSNEWENLYVKNIISTGSIAGFWQRNSGVISPTNITDDLAIGNTATGTAKFQIFGLTGNATTTGTLTFTQGGSQIQTTSFQTLTLGGTSTGGITLSPNNGNGIVTINGATVSTNANIIPTSTSVNLGSSSNYFGNAYLTNVIPSSTSQYQGFWQLNSGALSPFNISNDVLVGNTATGTAKFQIFANTGNATTAGNLTFNGTGNLIQTTNNQGLIIGGPTTGNITLSPLNGNGNVTISGLGTGVVQATGGVLSTGNVDLSSEVTGTLPLNHGGTNNGSLVADAGGIVYSDSTKLQILTHSITSGQCLLSGGSGSPTWGSCTTGGGTNFWNENQGALFPTNETLDLVLGSSTGSTTSAKFSVLNMTGSGTPTASVSSGLNGVGTYITANGTLQTTSDQGLTIGGASTGNITLTPQNGSGYVTINGNINSNLIPQTTNTFDLGSLTNQWNNLYVKNIISNGTIAGFWQRISGAVSPANITDDILAGGTGTTSAKFAVLNMTGTGNPTASVSSGLNGNGMYFDSTGELQTVRNQGLTIGGASTGNITISPLNGTAGSTIALNTGNITTNQTTVNLLNSTATTINFGGAATTVAIGAGSGTTINLNAAAIDDNQGTLSLFATPSNITFGGLATTLSIGNASGTTTVNNSLSVTGSVTLGTNNTKTIAANGEFSTGLIPNSTGSYDLGTPTLTWRNLYLSPTANYDGFWQQFNGALIPNNATDDVLAGGTSSTSAKFAVLNMTGSNTPTASVSSGLSGTGMYFDANGNLQTVRDETLNLGGTTTGNIAFKSNVASSILPYTTNTYDLGSSALAWNNIYARNIFQNGIALSQLWQENLGVLAPLNISDDLAVGNTATGTAKFQIFGLTGNATSEGNLTFDGTGSLIQTTRNQGLTIGGGTTGNITLSPLNGITGSSIALNASNITSNQTTVNLLNSTATTINFGGAATTLSMGAGSGATINLNGATIDSNQGTVGLFATPTSITLGNAATTVNIANNSLTTSIAIGGTGGTTTINNNLSVTGNVTLGTNNTKTIAANGEFTTGLIPNTSGTLDLGSPTLTWRNLYLSSTANYDGFWQRQNGVLSPNNITDDLVIGSTASLSARFHAYAFGGTVPAASASAKTSYAAFVVNNDGVGDVLAASSSSIPVFSIQANGKIVANQYSNAGGVLYTNGSGVLNQVFNASANTVLHGGSTPTFSAVDLTADVTNNLPLNHGGTNSNLTADAGGIVYSDASSLQILAHTNTVGQCLVSGGSSHPNWTNCGSASSNFWNLNQGTLFPINQTFDLTLGSSDGTGSTASAKFSVLNMTGPGTPTASVSSGLNGTGMYIAANGTIQTTSNQGLTIGGGSTGNITLSPLNSGNGSTVNLNAKTIDDNQATVALFGNPATVTLAGGANSLTLGVAGAGTTTFRNNTIDDNQGTVTLFGTPTNITLGGAATTLNLGAGTGTTTVENALSVAGNTTLGTNTSNTVTLNGLVNQDILPQSTSINLGNPTHYWGTVYANTFISPVSGGTSGFWTLSQNVLSPTNGWNDLAIGGTATGSATPFQVFATTVGVDTAGTATTSGNISFRGTPGAQTPFSLNILNGGTLAIKTSVGGDGGLGSVFTIANNGNLTTTATNIATTQTSLTLFDTLNSLTLATSGTGGSITLGNATGTTTIHGNIVLGNSSSNTLGINGLIASNLLPDVTNNRDLGNSSDSWRNLFLSQAITASNLYLPVTGGTGGYWSLNSNVVSPTNLWNDLAIGGTATGSANTVFQVFANAIIGGDPAGTASTAGYLTFTNATPKIQTTSMHPLTIGGASTGPIQLSPKGTTGLFVSGTGNVGIGTTAPSFPLVVSGSNPTAQFSGSIPALDLLSSQGPEWKLAAAYNDANSISLVDVSRSNHQRLYINSSGNTGLNAIDTGSIGNTALVVNQSNESGLGDIFSASASGTPEFTIANNGTIKNSIIPTLTDTYDLGSNPTTGGQEWNTLYVRQIVTPSTGGLAGFWQLTNQGVLAPANLTNDLIIGSTQPTPATSSALFQVFGNTGSASTAGNLTFTGTQESAASQIDLLNNNSLGFYSSVGGNGGLASAPNPELYLANSAVNSVGIGTNTPLTQTGLDIEKNSLGNASLIINQKGLGDVFTASVSGTTKFVVNNNGNVGIGPNVVTPQGILDVASAGPNFPSDFTLNQVAATNLIANPSFEYNVGNNHTNTWTFNHNPEFAASNPATESALFGSYALKMDSSRDSGSTFTATSQCIPVLGSKTFTLSAFQNVTAGFVGNIGINFQTFTDRGCTAGQATAGRVNSTTTGSWTRVTSTVTTGATVAGIEAQWIADSSSHGIAYLDGVQLEQNATATPYLDGSMGPGYYWDQTGTANATDSSRLVGSAFAYQTLNSASGIGAASRGSAPTLSLDQDGTGDIMTASASGVTQFQLTNAGILRARSFQDLDNTNYFIDPASSGIAGTFNGVMQLGTTTSNSTTSAELTDVGDLKAGAYDSTTWGQTAFNYRQKIVITNSGSALTNYQMVINLDTASIISAGKMQSACQDIRFTDNDGTTLLPYWIESGCNSQNGFVWIKIPSVPGSSSKNIYMYYGNATAASQSDITQVMNNNVFAMAWSSAATTLTDIQGVGINQTSGTATNYNNTQTNSNGICYENGSNTCANGNGNFDSYGQTNFTEKWIGFININATVAMCTDDGGNFRLNTTGNTNLNGANWTTGNNTVSNWTLHTVHYDSAGTINTGGVYQRFEYEHFNNGVTAYFTGLTSGANCNSSVVAIPNSDFYSPTLVQTPPTNILGTEQDKSQGGSLLYVNNNLNMVGIRTANPTNLLSIVGDYNGTNDGWAGDPNEGQFVIKGSTNQSLAFGIGLDTTNSVVRLQGQQISVGALPISLNPQGGNVGIGTTNVQRTLDVNGTWGGNVDTRNDSFTTGGVSTVGDSSTALAYYLNNDQGTANANVTTQYNLTGLPAVDGTFAFIYISPGKQSSSVARQDCINVNVDSQAGLLETGTTNSGCTSSTTGPDHTNGHRGFMVIRLNGQWRVANKDLTNTDTIDLAEWIPYTGQTPQPGELLVPGDSPTTVKRSDGEYEQTGLGIVTTNPNTVFGQQTDTSTRITLAGRVPAIVTSLNGPISSGDSITTSPLSGIGMKPSQATSTIGKALESFNPTNATCTTASSLDAIQWPQDDGTNSSHPCFKVPVNSLDQATQILLFNEYGYTESDYFYVGKVMTLVGTSYIDPNASLKNLNGFTVAIQNGKYILKNASGQFVNGILSARDAMFATLTTGLLKAQDITTNTLALATDNMTIAGQSLRNYIISIVQSAGFTNGNNINSPIASIGELHTNLISPLASSSAIAVDLQNSQFTISNSATGAAVASIDNTGNATFSGTVNSQNLAVNGDATVSGTLHAGKIVASDIEGLQAVVGTLSAQNITNVTNMYFATASSSTSGENFAMGQNNNSSTSSGLLTPSLGYTNLASYSGFLAYVPNLSADTAMFNQGLVSLGSTSLGDTTVTGQLSIGTNLILADSSVNVLGQSFEIQPLRQGGVNFEGGLIAIDTDGNLTVNGNAVFSKDLAANIISPLSNNRNLTFQLGQNPTATGAALATSNLSVQNASGSGIFTVDQLGNVIASGAASIGKLNFNLVQPALAVSNTEVIATGSAGTAFIKPYETEVTIDDTLVTDKSLIYITPVGTSTTPYLLRQVDKTSFTVGLPTMTAQQIQFNFLIVN